MRINEIAARNYTRQQDGRNGYPGPSHRRTCLQRPVISITDSLELASSTTVADNDLRWLAAYIRLIPDDLAAERVHEILYGHDSTDALYNILIFDIL